MDSECPDQTAVSALSDLGLCCPHITQRYIFACWGSYYLVSYCCCAEVRSFIDIKTEIYMDCNEFACWGSYYLVSYCCCAEVRLFIDIKTGIYMDCNKR